MTAVVELLLAAASFLAGRLRVLPQFLVLPQASVRPAWLSLRLGLLEGFLAFLLGVPAAPGSGAESPWPNPRRS